MIILPLRDRDLVAPLGLASTDGLGGSPILDGLSARVWPENRESRQGTATINGAGIAGFHRLPGLTLNRADPFAGPTRAFIVEVRDTLGRFQAGRVRVVAPARGLTTVVMHSAPTRSVAPSRLEFRAELWDAVNNRPAAFALLTVKVAGNGGTTIATGLADAAGRLLAIGDWPAPKSPLAGPAAGLAPRWDAARPLILEIQYDPAAPPGLPRLDLVAGAPVARAWNRRAPDEPLTVLDLVANNPVVFRSTGDALGRLLVTSP
jgi:hypothetical protein